MRKRKKTAKFSRERAQRKALLLSLCRALLLKEKIQTTKAKAKATSQLAERLITIAKTGNLASRRRLRQYMAESLASKLLQDIAPRYRERHGGYTRILKLGKRITDGSEMAIVELVK